MGWSVATGRRRAGAFARGLALVLVTACLAAGAVRALAADLTFPALTGRVVDAAGILTPEQRAGLEAKLKAHEDKTSDQVVVATVPNLQGTTVEDYANRLFRAWQIGQAKANNGALLLVAPAERKVRIEVGYGLEGALTDALSRVIIASAITPRFKTGDYDGGINAGVDGILSILSGDAQEWQRKPQVRTDEVNPAQVALFVAVFLLVLFVAWRMNRGGRAGRGGGVIVLPGPSPAGGAAASRMAGSAAEAAASRAGAARPAAGEPRVAGRRAPVLDAEACARIARAVMRAEAGTSGEIVVMLAAKAGAYRSLVLSAALVAALVLPWPLIALTAWSAAGILLAQAALAAAILAASLHEPLRLALVPARLRRARVREAGRRAFWSRGLSRTQGRTGVLLYLALAERHAEIVADLGVLEHIPPDAWTGILADLVAALARGEAEGGLTAAVERVGACLAEHLPAGPHDPDELPNRVIVAD